MSRWRPMATAALAVAAGFLGCGGPGPDGNGKADGSAVLSCPEEASARERIECYEAALRGNPDSARILAQLAGALLDEGNPTGVIDRLGPAVRRDPDDPELQYRLAVAFEQLGDMERAIERYETVLELVASHEVHVVLAMLLSEQGRHEEAITHYQEAIVLAPDDVDAHYNLGVELGRAGRHQAAAEHYRHVLRVDQTHGEAMNNLGAALSALGRPAEAAEHFERAVRLDPTDVQARGNWAMALIAQDRVGDAIEVLEEGLARAPDAVALANQLSWLRATAREAQWRDGKEAVRLAEMVCQSTDWADGNHLDTLAAAYAEAERFEEAVRTAQRAIALVAENPELAREFRHRLSLYQDGEAYRDQD